jgi:coenzyme PQQ precursor peptide PqqA
MASRYSGGLGYRRFSLRRSTEREVGKEGLQAHTPEEESMSWTTPKVIEISVGMEINSYACADL